MRVLPDTEKLEFVRKSVSWIQGRDIMDTCFILNFGYEAPLPLPQVLLDSISTIHTPPEWANLQFSRPKKWYTTYCQGPLGVPKNDFDQI